MEEVNLLYTGKKDMLFKNDAIGANIHLQPGRSFWTSTSVATWLLKFNYTDFREIGNRGGEPEEPIEDAAAIIEKAEEPEDPWPVEPPAPDEEPPVTFSCPKCGKEYAKQGNLDRHLERCGK